MIEQTVEATSKTSATGHYFLNFRLKKDHTVWDGRNWLPQGKIFKISGILINKRICSPRKTFIYHNLIPFYQNAYSFSCWKCEPQACRCYITELTVCLKTAIARSYFLLKVGSPRRWFFKILYRLVIITQGEPLDVSNLLMSESLCSLQENYNILSK